jgi:hypothetical protein
MSRRRVRASSLLHAITVIVSIGAVLLTFVLGASTGTMVVCVPLALGLVVLTETGLLPLWLERLAARRVRNQGGPIHSIWFVDLDERETLR